MLLIVWYLPFFNPPPNQSIVAWKMAATFIPISFGWAAGDVSLAAYIQASLARGGEATTAGISTLGAVMSFLYVTYVRPVVLLPCSHVDFLLFQIITYAILSPLLGSYVDSQVRYVSRHKGSSTYPTDAQYRQNQVHRALLNVGAVHFTILSGMILIASMTPRGALRLNPQLISDEIGKDFEEVQSPEQLRLGKARPISEKDGESSMAATEPDTNTKHETSFDASSVHSPATPTNPTSPLGPISQHSHNSQASGAFNTADDRERERRRSLGRQRSASRSGAGRESQRPVIETRVHMPTGARVDLNVSTRALPVPPSPYSQSPQSPQSPRSPHSFHSPHTPVVERTHPHY